jgi:hypothetical protein
MRRRFDALRLAARGRNINTVSKLLRDAGRFCAGYHDANVHDVKAMRVQVDEIWSFTAAKQKNVAQMKALIAGATWTWTAIEAETKLIISHFVGGRDGDCTKWFMDDVAARLATRAQLRSDGHKAYLGALEGAFVADVDYAMLVKIYGTSPESAKESYSPAKCTGAIKTPIEGNPKPKAHFHELRRALQSHHADAQSAIYAPHECVLQEIRELRSHGRDLGRLVQLASHPQNAPRYAYDGRRPFRHRNGLG